MIKPHERTEFSNTRLAIPSQNQCRWRGGIILHWLMSLTLTPSAGGTQTLGQQSFCLRRVTQAWVI